MRTWKPDTTSRRTSPRPVGWKTLRRDVLTRDGYRCTWIDGHPQGILQPPGGVAIPPGAQHAPALYEQHPDRCGAPATDVDHLGAPDDHRTETLRSLCGPHHDHRTGQQASHARWSKPQARRQRPTPRHPGLR